MKLIFQGLRAGVISDLGGHLCYVLEEVHEVSLHYKHVQS